jgi:cytochrome o ubiquinol oxidase subunit 2
MPSFAPILDPKGAIGLDERNLIIIATLLMLVVVVPVFVLLFTFARKYRAGNTKAKYSPDLDHNPLAGFAFWAILAGIISVLAVINWKSTHALDPYKPIVSDAKPITIQVVALRWKWLFIYPEQNIATVNYIQFPEKTPLNFELTADAPMNSFWIPQLGGQMYAMPGMSTQLHLIANETGEFRGSGAEMSGPGFAGMKFIAKATSQADFDQWVQSVKRSSTTLSLDTYEKLAEPSENDPVVFYASIDESLYTKIMMKFMAPMSGMPTMQ